MHVTRRIHHILISEPELNYSVWKKDRHNHFVCTVLHVHKNDWGKNLNEQTVCSVMCISGSCTIWFLFECAIKNISRVWSNNSSISHLYCRKWKVVSILYIIRISIHIFMWYVIEEEDEQEIWWWMKRDVRETHKFMLDGRQRHAYKTHR